MFTARPPFTATLPLSALYKPRSESERLQRARHSTCHPLCVCRSRDGPAVPERVLWERLFHVGWSTAACMGMARQDREDFACDFRLFMMTRRAEELSRYRQGYYPEMWLRLCAHNAVVNYLRYLSRHQTKETSFDAVDECELDCLDRKAEAGLTADHTLYRDEFWQLVSLAIKHLNADQQALFARRFHRGESVAEIAVVLNKTGNAVRQNLLTLHRQLKRIMLRMGRTEEDFTDYLSLLNRHPE